MNKVTSIRHAAFVVSDLEESLAFYANVLGLKVYRREVEEGDFIDMLTGLKALRLEWVKLIIPSGGLIELLRYHNYPDISSKCLDKCLSPSDPNRVGASHVALTVTDLDSLYREIIDAGYETKSEPIIVEGTGAKILYAMDPDGAIIELIEDPVEK